MANVSRLATAQTTYAFRCENVCVVEENLKRFMDA